MRRMSLGCVLFGLLVPACGYQASSDISIVNGEVPSADQSDARTLSTVAYGNTGGIKYGDAFCSGTLIAPRVVMTAGHCISWSKGAISFGRKVGPDVVVLVRKTVRHEKYASTKKDIKNDIALLFLESDAPAPFQVAPRYAGELNVGDSLHVAGYGVTSFGGGGSGLLRQAEVQVSSINNDVTPELFLAGKNGEDTCQGDSGGPAYVRVDDHLEVVGITSWGDGCGNGGHYTDIRAFEGWIQEKIAAN